MSHGRLGATVPAASLFGESITVSKSTASQLGKEEEKIRSTPCRTCPGASYSFVMYARKNGAWSLSSFVGRAPFAPIRVWSPYRLHPLKAP